MSTWNETVFVSGLLYRSSLRSSLVIIVASGGISGSGDRNCNNRDTVDKSCRDCDRVENSGNGVESGSSLGATHEQCDYLRMAHGMKQGVAQALNMVANTALIEMEHTVADTQGPLVDRLRVINDRMAERATWKTKISLLWR